MSDNSKQKRILICDDEVGVRESLNLILSDKYALIFAEHGVDALEQISRIESDLILLDIKMPKMHGLEVLRHVKEIKPETPVIIVTGYQSAEIASEALKLGASDYIPKPFESEQILTAVSKVLT